MHSNLNLADSLSKIAVCYYWFPVRAAVQLLGRFGWLQRPQGTSSPLQSVADGLFNHKNFGIVQKLLS